MIVIVFSSGVYLISTNNWAYKSALWEAGLDQQALNGLLSITLFSTPLCLSGDWAKFGIWLVFASAQPLPCQPCIKPSVSSILLTKINAVPSV
jgi:hypothetical protein